MRRIYRTIWLVGLLSCGGDGGGDGGNEPNPPPPGFSMTGAWSGSSGGVTITADVVDNAGAISGTGTLAGGASDCDQTTAGNRTGYDFSVTFTCVGFLPIRFAGTMPSASQMTGELNGSGFTEEPFQMTKVP